MAAGGISTLSVVTVNQPGAPGKCTYLFPRPFLTLTAPSREPYQETNEAENKMGTHIFLMTIRARRT